jgi:hypothetical protein
MACAPIAGSLCPAISMVAPTNDIVYFSTAPDGLSVRSKLWKITNGSTTPIFTEITGTLPDRYYSGIEVDPTDPNRVFVTLFWFWHFPYIYECRWGNYLERSGWWITECSS